MDIVFLCGSLEPGHDGVGDYTRRLAAQLIMQGYKVAALALNDTSISATWVGTQVSDGIHVPVTRIESGISANERFSYARKWIDECNPHIISLQFVIFSFNYKGLPFDLANQLAKLGLQRTWHIMFHELWVGMPTYATWKQILWGQTQLGIIKSILFKLKPAVIHTHTAIYQEQLKKLGFTSQLLPLFSNIPLHTSKASTSITQFHSTELNFIVFGTIHSHNQIRLFADEAKRFYTETGTRVNLFTIGRCGAELSSWMRIWQATGLRIHVLGEQSSESISALLKSASIGITSTPLPLVEKSGSVAAMREHGLPVICIAEPWMLRNSMTTVPPAGVFGLRKGVIAECLAYQQHSLNTIPSVATIATSYYTSLSQYLHPRVSVCIPTYNQSNFIEQAIRSAAEQTVTPLEIIVSDDCSTDETPLVLERLTREIPLLKIIRQAQNVGIAQNANTCFQLASGEFVVRLDSDDCLYPTYIAELAKLLASRPEAGYAHADVQEINKDNQMLNTRRLARRQVFQSADDALKASRKGYRVAANIIMFKREALSAVGYVSVKADFAEDFNLAASIAAAGFGNVYLGKVLSFYRVWLDDNQVRHRRKIAEIAGVRTVFEDVIEPAYLQRGWDLGAVSSSRASLACAHANCLGWDRYTEQEKVALGIELQKLSPSTRLRWLSWLYLNNMGALIGILSKSVYLSKSFGKQLYQILFRSGLTF